MNEVDLNDEKVWGRVERYREAIMKSLDDGYLPDDECEEFFLKVIDAQKKEIGKLGRQVFDLKSLLSGMAVNINKMLEAYKL